MHVFRLLHVRSCCLQADYISGRQVCGDVTELLKVKDHRTSTWPDELWLKIMSVGHSCTALRRTDRPGMTDVRLDSWFQCAISYFCFFHLLFHGCFTSPRNTVVNLMPLSLTAMETDESGIRSIICHCLL
jgi:hypothetical protein